MQVDLEAVRSDIAQLKQDLRLLMDDMGAVAKNRAHRAKERVGEAMHEFKDRAGEAAQAAKEKGRVAAEKAEETITDHPFASVGIAFGVGLLLGAVLTSRR